MVWLSQWHNVALFLVLLYPVGWAFARAFGVRGILSVASAPVFSGAILVLATIGFSALGVPWKLGWVALLLGVVTTVLLLLPSARASATSVSGRGRWAIVDTVALAVACSIVLLPIAQGMRGPEVPTQGWDGVFHLNAVSLIERSGDASPLGGLSAMYGLVDSTVPYYPTLFHAIASLGFGTVQSVNVLILTSVGIWIVGLLGLSRFVFPDVRWAPPFVVLSAGAFIGFPSVLVVLNQFPHILSVSLLPGALAVALSLSPFEEGVGKAGPLARWAVVCVAIGIAFFGAHSTSIFSFLIALTVAAITQVPATVRSLWRYGERTRAVLSAGIPILMSCGLAVVFSLPKVAAMGGYARRTLSAADGLVSVVSDVVDLGNGLGATAIISILVIAGVVTGILRRRTAWVAATWIVFAGLFVLAYMGSDGPMRTLVGPWYSEAHRIRAVVDTFSPLLAIMPFAFFAGTAYRPISGRILAPLTAGTLVVAFLVSGGFRWDERVNRWTADIWDPARMGIGTTAYDNQIAELRIWGEALPPDSLVIGDPTSPVAYLDPIAGRATVFRQFSLRGVYEGPYAVLLNSFNQIHKDPAVCSAVREIGATHYVAVDDRQFGDIPQSGIRPGLYNVDTSHGFELVADAHALRVYRITACED